jgi:hypothetical protein
MAGGLPMGINLDRILLLQRRGCLSPTNNRILDIGPQNVVNPTEQQIREFVRNQGLSVSRSEFEAAIPSLLNRAPLLPLLSEFTDLTNIEYNAVDICPDRKTMVFDLNYDHLRPPHVGTYDLVINSGTTEHVVNQWNSFELMHQAVRVGGAIYCQLPASGYLHHGYFCYTPLFFRDFADANGYEMIELFLQIAGFDDPFALGLDVRSAASIGTSNSADRDPRLTIPCFNIHALMKKLKNAPFKGTMEIATAGAPVNPFKARRYVSDPATMRKIAYNYYRFKASKIPLLRWLYFQSKSVFCRN